MSYLTEWIEESIEYDNGVIQETVKGKNYYAKEVNTFVELLDHAGECDPEHLDEMPTRFFTSFDSTRYSLSEFPHITKMSGYDCYSTVIRDELRIAGLCY